jgi:hypothetical protein
MPETPKMSLATDEQAGDRGRLVHVEAAAAFDDRFHLCLQSGEVIATPRYEEKRLCVLPVSGCDKGWYLNGARVSLLLGVGSHRSVSDLEAIISPLPSLPPTGPRALCGATPFASRVVGHRPIPSTEYIDGVRGSYVQTAFVPHEVAARFGMEDRELDALSWEWQTADGEPLDDAALEGISLVSTTMGARVPPAQAPPLMGKDLSREGLAELGFLKPTGHLGGAPAAATAADSARYVDVPEAAKILGISEEALRGRIKRDQVWGVVRTGSSGRRIQFDVEKLRPKPGYK